MTTKFWRWSKNHLIHFPRAFWANMRFGWPSRRLKTIGVTGTDGKTTTTLIIYHFLNAINLAAGHISTITAQVAEKKELTGLHTTSPAPFLLQSWLRQMASQAPGKWAVLETTSHGLDQYRFWGIHFDVGVFTNLSREHIDYHGTMANYLAAKLKLLRMAKLAVINRDDLHFDDLKRSLGDKKIVSYGLDKRAIWRAEAIKFGLSETSFRLFRKNKDWGVFHSQLSGKFNLYNQLAALATVLEIKLLNVKQARSSLASFTPPVGRMELVSSGKPYKIMIDFAHTPNALRELLENLRQVHRGRLIVIFGAAGNRDRGKRPLMGEIVGQLADVAILTSEDPRREKPWKIIMDISKGCRRSGMRLGRKKDAILVKQAKINKLFFRIENRQQAINFGLRKLARKGDLVVICGKGHEKSICYGRQEYPWSEHQAVKVALSSVK